MCCIGTWHLLFLNAQHAFSQASGQLKFSVMPAVWFLWTHWPWAPPLVGSCNALLPGLSPVHNASEIFFQKLRDLKTWISHNGIAIPQDLWNCFHFFVCWLKHNFTTTSTKEIASPTRSIEIRLVFCCDVIPFKAVEKTVNMAEHKQNIWPIAACGYSLLICDLADSEDENN